MKYIGLNKKLLDRRKELDYSVLEACIRLDISKRKLYLIEHGYIKVKDPELQARFIRKYKLEDDFFTKDELLYPTPIEAPEKEKKVTKLGKFIASWPFKIGCLVMLGGFVAMAACGLTMSPKLTKETSSFFSKEFNDVKEVARSEEYGIKHSSIDSVASTLCGDDYYALESIDSVPSILGSPGLWHSGVNFIGSKDDSGNFNNENLSYTFYTGLTSFDEEIIGIGTIINSFEARYVENNIRFQYYAYFYDQATKMIGDECAHISADFNKNNKTFTYNLVEVINIFSFDVAPTPVDPKSFEYMIFTAIFESQTEAFENSLKALFNDYKDVINNVTYEQFDESLNTGIKNYTSYQSLVSGLTLWGLILSILFLAFLAFSFIKGGINKFRESVLKMEADGGNTPIENEIDTSKKVKPLPKNKWITPFIPEMVIRILVLVISTLSSLGIFYIFQAVMQGDVGGVVSSIVFKAEIASLATLSMMLLFFTKLDIQQSKKNTFLVNYILFFLGLVFYFVLLIIQFMLSNSTTATASMAKEALPYLPGNIVWGILAFNLLSSILFSTPKFKNDTKVKHVLYRSLIIIPLGYMLVSCIYQIGNKAAGWVWPFAVTSLLFNKALILTAFTVLYCLVVFIYKTYTKKKYGENAAIYQTGNRYIFIKNILVCLVVAALGIIDIIIGKTMGTNNPLGAGGNFIILFTIPFILFYHPHLGQRNSKWDIAFAGLYALSMVIGILLVASNLTVYITSL